MHFTHDALGFHVHLDRGELADLLSLLDWSRSNGRHCPVADTFLRAFAALPRAVLSGDQAQPASAPPLVRTGQGEYTRDWPEPGPLCATLCSPEPCGKPIDPARYNGAALDVAI